jgi:hypothetical protein
MRRVHRLRIPSRACGARLAHKDLGLEGAFLDIREIQALPRSQPRSAMREGVNVPIGSDLLQPPQRPIQPVHHERRPLNRRRAIIRHLPDTLIVDALPHSPLVHQLLRNPNALTLKFPPHWMPPRLPALVGRSLHPHHPLRPH